MLLPAGLAMAACFPLAGRLSDRVDARVLLVTGAALFACSMMMLADVSMQTEFSAIALAPALGRAGIGVIMPAANASAMRHARGTLASAAPAATFLSQTGGALGAALLSALLSALLTQRTAFHGDMLLPFVNLAVTDGNLTLAEASRQVWSAALLLKFRDCFLVTGLAGIALIPVGMLVGDRSNFTDRLKRPLTLFR